MVSADRQTILKFLTVKTIFMEPFTRENMLALLTQLLVEENLEKFLTPEEMATFNQQRQECGIQGIATSRM